MPPSSRRQKVEDLALKIDSETTLDDFDFNGSVQVMHEEGTCLWYQNATARRYKDEEGYGWVIVFPEHHQPHVFDEDDLDGIIMMTQRVEIPYLKQ